MDAFVADMEEGHPDVVTTVTPFDPSSISDAMLVSARWRVRALRESGDLEKMNENVEMEAEILSRLSGGGPDVVKLDCTGWIIFLVNMEAHFAENPDDQEIFFKICDLKETLKLWREAKKT